MNEQMIPMKRIDVGARIKADTTGLGDIEIGYITDYDKKAGRVTFVSLKDGEAIDIDRQHVCKCTKAEYEEAQQMAEQAEEQLEQSEGLEAVEQAAEAGEPVMEDDKEALDEHDKKTQSRSIVPSQYRARYQKVKVDGKQTYDCGDEVAQMLRGLDIADIAGVLANAIDGDKHEIMQRYEHLNNGQQRMVIGNRLRKVIKEQGLTVDQLSALLNG